MSSERESENIDRVWYIYHTDRDAPSSIYTRTHTHTAINWSGFVCSFDQLSACARARGGGSMPNKRKTSLEPCVFYKLGIRLISRKPRASAAGCAGPALPCNGRPGTHTHTHFGLAHFSARCTWYTYIICRASPNDDEREKRRWGCVVVVYISSMRARQQQERVILLYTYPIHSPRARI